VQEHLTTRQAEPIRTPSSLLYPSIPKDRRTRRALTAKAIRVYERGLSLSETANEVKAARYVLEQLFKQTGYKLRPMGEGVRLAKLGRRRQNFEHPAHPGEGPASSWSKVKLYCIDRKSCEEIAKELNRAYPCVYWDLRDMGLPSGRPCYDEWGEVFDREALRRLARISGLKPTQLSPKIGIPFATLEAALSKRKPQQQLDLDTARKAVEFETSLFKQLRRGEHYSQARVIRTFLPNLSQKYSLTLGVLHRLSEALDRNSAWSVAEFKEYLCEQAFAETKGRVSGDMFRRFLPWAPRLMPFLESELGALRGVHHQPVAWRVIAKSLGTTWEIIRRLTNRAQAQQVEPIPPAEMRAFILFSAGTNGHGRTATEARPTKKRRTKDTLARFTVAAYLELQRTSEWDMGPILYPAQNIRDNAYRSAYQHLRENRTEIDAEKVRLQDLTPAEKLAKAEAARSVYHPEDKPKLPLH
jgi:hypothetical protein